MLGLQGIEIELLTRSESKPEYLEDLGKIRFDALQAVNSILLPGQPP